MSLTTRQFGPSPKNAKLSIEEMDDNLLYLEQLAQSGFKKITISLGLQYGGSIEINSVNYDYLTLNEENLFFGQGSDADSFYEDTDGLIHIGQEASAPVPA